MSTLAPERAAASERLRIDVAGAVQGVGFRPFVHRLAASEGLGGFVCNTPDGATVEIEGPSPAIARFLRRLDAELRPPARIDSRSTARLAPKGSRGFAIADSLMGTGSAAVLPDLVTCPDCLREVFDPGDRRHLYPFTTCMHCGPRYTIVEALPYDRARTSMRHFPMCPACIAEYSDPHSRRFHAETNACPVCGPRLRLLDARGHEVAEGTAAFDHAGRAVRIGAIVALKGLGGYQLLADARNEAAVATLRDRKRRPRKPFAVMVADLGAARHLAAVSAIEAETLASAAGPIVLVRAREHAAVAPSVAPKSPLLGLMLPTTPLHHMLARDLGIPLVCTSGNRGDEPIVCDDGEAPTRLAGIADLFLAHDRPIVRPVDDSVVRVIAGAPTVLRNARGYAPAVFASPGTKTATLALGGHQKDAIALGLGDRIVLGPHIGDLDSRETRAALDRAVDDLPRLHGRVPEAVACDAHPDYHTTHAAGRSGLPIHRVPHHLAHVLSGMLDSGLDGPVLGVTWDGTGYGGDGTSWGSEFLAVSGGHWRRAAHLLPFRLPGGDAVIRQPVRSALGVLHALGDDATELAIPAAERRILDTMLARGVNAPLTSSAGRLFDAVAALLGLCREASFEGEAAMAVEYASGRATDAAQLAPMIIGDALDWRPTLASLLAGHRAGVPPESLALGFHHVLADTIAAVARRIGIADVLLTGGCFQNALLAELALDRLAAAGFAVHLHRRIPPNDGGLAAGQALFAARPLQREMT